MHQTWGMPLDEDTLAMLQEWNAADVLHRFFLNEVGE